MLFDVSVAILSKFPKACRKHPDPVPSDQQLGRKPNPQEWHLDILDWRPRDRVLQEMGNDGNGITGTTAQRFKLCLMFAPRCLLFCLMDLLPLF